MSATGIATAKLINIPIEPIPSGEIPRNQSALEVPGINLNQMMYAAVKTIPQIMPATAPVAFMRFQKIPRSIAGKKLLAARPKAKATTAAT